MSCACSSDKKKMIHTLVMGSIFFATVFATPQVIRGVGGMKLQLLETVIFLVLVWLVMKFQQGAVYKKVSSTL